MLKGFGILIIVVGGYLMILQRLSRIEAKIVQAVALRWTSIDDKHFAETLCKENNLTMVEHRAVTDWNRIQGMCPPEPTDMEIMS
jgi:hypothetical protein